ncbi:MAG: LysM peptidoglycan-binding domain-containing protein [Desulfobacterales bacterium]|nr:LysM peptidoglycan-binding domain-containing protein [Desulfobacterales bacterium]
MERPSPQIPPKPKASGSSTQGTALAKKSSSLLKPQEVVLILVIALALITLVYYMFIPRQGSGPDSQVANGELLKRLEAVEATLARLSEGGDGDLSPVSVDGAPSGQRMAQAEEKVDRMETRVMLKYDALGDRMARMEKKLNALQSRVAKVSASKPRVVKSKPKAKPKSSVQKVAAKVKAPVKSTAKKKPVFHTVKKGETLWRISKKYNISVAQLRSLNKLSAKDKIYPGSHLLVR